MHLKSISVLESYYRSGIKIASDILATLFLIFTEAEEIRNVASIADHNLLFSALVSKPKHALEAEMISPNIDSEVLPIPLAVYHKAFKNAKFGV